MKNATFSCLLFLTLFSCKSKEPLPCEGPQPSGRICENGVYRCMPDMVEVPGAAAGLGCVPKGFYDFICTNPCPPYSAMLLRSGGFVVGPDLSGSNVMTLQIVADDSPQGNGDWGPTRDEKLFATQPAGSEEIRLEMPQPAFYRIWDETRQSFSKNHVEGRLNASRDTLFLTYWHGWDPARDYRENRCDLVFVKTDLLR